MTLKDQAILTANALRQMANDDDFIPSCVPSWVAKRMIREHADDLMRAAVEPTNA